MATKLRDIFPNAAARLAALVLVVSMATLSPAPINDPRAATLPTPERNQEQVTHEQNSFQGTFGPAGVAPDDTEPNENIQVEMDSEGRSVLDSAQNEPKSNAKQVLNEADRGLKTRGRGGPGLWLGGIFLVLGFGVVVAFRTWANKAVPELPGSNGKAKW